MGNELFGTIQNVVRQITNVECEGNDMMKKIGSLIFQGFFLGVGFLIAVTIYTATEERFYDDSYLETEQVSDSLEAIESSGLLVTNTFTRNHSSWIDALGTVRNAGDEIWTWVEVEITFYDEDGKLLDIDSAHISEPIMPGGERHYSKQMLHASETVVGAYASHKCEILKAKMVNKDDTQQIESPDSETFE